MSTKVCLCKHVLKDTVEKAIREGADTIDQVRMRTGAGCGACKGTRCHDKIHEMVQNSR